MVVHPQQWRVVGASFEDDPGWPATRRTRLGKPLRNGRPRPARNLERPAADFGGVS